MMNIEKLKDARYTAGYTTVSKLTEMDWTELREISKELIDEAIARQSVKSEDVQEAIEYLQPLIEYLQPLTGHSVMSENFVKHLKTVITALQEYQPWVSVEDRLPKSGKEILMNVTYNNRNQSKYDKIAKGFYVESFSIKEETWSDYTGNEDYCEEDDTYYIRQGWYSVCNFVDDFSYIDVPSGFTVTHWKPLPEPPKGE